jgi:hypothetical protein
MAEFVRRWWPYPRILLGLTAVAIFATHFARDLLDRRIREGTRRPGWIELKPCWAAVRRSLMLGIDGIQSPSPD